MPRIVYSRHYNIGFAGLQRLHPFDMRKYGRAWKLLRSHFGWPLRRLRISPRRPANRDELLLVHTPEYLSELRKPIYLARALEVPQLSRLPLWLIDWLVLRPMRWATRGTILAAQAALTHGFAVNLSGGYHHAKPNRGEGFSIYSDIAIAVAALRRDKLLGETDRVLYVDTDAHQGNGICHAFISDSRILIFDIFNAHIYPLNDALAQQRIDCKVPLASFTDDLDYLLQLTSHLAAFLESVDTSNVKLAIYNAGTDVFSGDPLGKLSISAATIRERDLFVVGELRRRRIPTVMLLSGGYTKQSFQLVANSVIPLIERESSAQL